MKLPATWSEFLAYQLAFVDPTHELRPLADCVVQYIESGIEYIAVHNADGYGAAIGEAQHFLTKEAAGQDFSVYRVPPYLVSIPAVTRDAWDAGLEGLRPVYRAIGRLLYEASSSVAARPPMVSVSDLAVDIRTGIVFYLPPLQFNVMRDHQGAVYVSWMTASIARTFGSLLTRHAILELQSEVIKGASI